MLIIFQSGNFQNSTPVAVRVFKTGMLKLHGREIQRMLGGEKYNNVRRRKYKNVRRRKYKVAAQARENTWSGDKNADSLVCDLRVLTDLACQLDAPAPSWNVSFSTQYTHVQKLDSKYTQIQATCHHLRFMCHFHQVQKAYSSFLPLGTPKLQLKVMIFIVWDGHLVLKGP